MNIDKRWLNLRERVIDAYGNLCMCCGKIVHGNELHIDHIYPKSLYPQFKYNLANLQVLCAKCNIKKSNKNTKDYRTSEQKRVFGEILIERDIRQNTKTRSSTQKIKTKLSTEERKAQKILNRKIRTDFHKILRGLSEQSNDTQIFVYMFINKYGVKRLYDRIGVLPERIKNIINRILHISETSEK